MLCPMPSRRRSGAGKADPAQKALFAKSRKEELRATDKIVITDYIARNPEFLKRGIGLDPKAFKK